MRSKPLIVLPAAARDVRSAVVHYRGEAGETVAIRFLEALQRQYRTISERPGIGSQRYASNLAIDQLRTVPVKGFPYLLFYVDTGDRIEVWRVLHMSRDIPASFQD